MQLHAAAGGPASAPIYASIDDDPSYEQYKSQVAPYLRSWESVIGHQRTGVYANSKTIDWALHDGLGSYFWQHNWGSPKGYAHPAANLHQVEIDKRSVGGVGVDINEILKPAIRSVGLDPAAVVRSTRDPELLKFPANTRSLVLWAAAGGQSPPDGGDDASTALRGPKFLCND